ncbi:MAG: FkbM family methyltransferase [Chthoniobacterales bacterium]
MNPFNFVPGRWKEKLRLSAGAITLRSRLENLRRAGFRPTKIIDAGAFRGHWAQSVLEVYPEACVLLIEPQSDCQTVLQALAAADKRVSLRQTLLGKSAGEMRFLVEGSNSRVLTGEWTPGPGARVENYPVATLYDVAREEGFSDAQFIKLDLQGHELDALAGAGDLFGRCELFLVEVSWLRIGEVPLMHEVLRVFVEKGYQPYDILGHNYRRRDRALWQTDIMFVRGDSPLIASREWA